MTKIILEGSTILSGKEADEMFAESLGKELTVEGLVAIKNRVTRWYIDHGYVTSGAMIPEQKVEDGVVRIRVVEGRLSAVKVSGNKYLRDKFIIGRLQLPEGEALNISRLEERLQMLRQNALVEQVHSELKPGLRVGEAVLYVRVEEYDPLEFSFGINNQGSPSTDPWRHEYAFGHESITGHGDHLRVTLAKTQGVREKGLSYSIPVSDHDTTLSLRFTESDGAVIIEPFDDLDISSHSRVMSIGVRHPFHKSIHDEVAGSLTLSRRESETFLLGESFAFSEGTDEGRVRVNALGLGQEWIHRDSRQVIAGVSNFSIGLKAGDTTTWQENPDGVFLAWLGQFQWVRLLPVLDSQLSFHVAARLVNHAMLSSEKFGLGGMNSVRGYRENLIARDQGVLERLEWRIPTPLHFTLPSLSGEDGDGRVSLALFQDWGQSWDRDVDDDLKPQIPVDLSSIGAGLIWEINRGSRMEFYWAKPLRKVEWPDEDPQDRGIHFRLHVDAF